jgi:hypothetical protein
VFKLFNAVTMSCPVESKMIGSVTVAIFTPF